MDHRPQIDALISRIRDFRKDREMSRHELAVRAGLSRAALVGMDKPNWGPTASTIRKLEAVIPLDWKPGRKLNIASERAKTSGKRRRAA